MKNRKKFWRLVPLAIVLSFVLMGADECEGEDAAPSVDSDSSQEYKPDSKIPVDDGVYEVTGEVSAEVNSVTRQVEAGGGELSGPTCFGTSGCYGGTSASFFGPVEKGKGYVRLLVQSTNPETSLASVGQVAILKVSDTKATALLPGDIVTFKCRRQYEAIAAVKDNQTFDADAVETWELDYCRLASPEITVRKEP